MYRHSVVFTLVHPEGSPEERALLRDAKSILATVPGVRDINVARQVSPKNHHRFLLEMSFADRAAFEAYLVHPIHEAFVAERWIPESDSVIDLDYEPLDLD